MTIDDVIKLVNAGFKADQIAQMYAAEKIDPPAQDQVTPPPTELPTPITATEAQQTPLSVPAESPKVEAPTDPNKEIEDLKKQLEESKASVQSLQNLMASVNVAGTAKQETAEDYLKKIFSEMY